jgi:hypothetical protein
MDMLANTANPLDKVSPIRYAKDLLQGDDIRYEREVSQPKKPEPISVGAENYRTQMD